MSTKIPSWLELSIGHVRAELFYTLITTGVLEILEAGPKTPTEVAAAGSLVEERVGRVLRAAAAQGFVGFDASSKKYSINDYSKDYVGENNNQCAILHLLGFEAKRAWAELSLAVKEGSYPYLVAHGEGYFEHLAKHPEESVPFNAFMTKVSLDKTLFTNFLTQSYDFSKFKQIVDVGGGQGGLVSELLRINTQAKGIVYDQPAVVESGKKKLETEYKELKDRLEFVGGDFFASVPSGGDLYAAKMIIHDWNDEKATKILKNIHKVLPDDGTLLIIDMVVKDGEEFSTRLDIQMMVLCDGKERSEVEFAELLDKSGFKLTKIVHLSETFPQKLIEAVKK